MREPDVVDNYIMHFSAALDSKLAWRDMLARCHRRRNPKLQAVVDAIGDCDIKGEDAMAKVFIAFLTGDDEVSAIIARLHTTSLGAFDAFDIPFAAQLKDVGRKMLECEYAVWRAHYRLLAAFKSAAVRRKLDRSKAMEKLMLRSGGFDLHEQLCFAEMWRDLFPETT